MISYTHGIYFYISNTICENLFFSIRTYHPILVFSMLIFSAVSLVFHVHVFIITIIFGTRFSGVLSTTYDDICVLCVCFTILGHMSYYSRQKHVLTFYIRKNTKEVKYLKP